MPRPTDDALARWTYDFLRSEGKLNRRRTIAYVCARDCLLLDVVRTPEGMIVHHPPYRLAPAANLALSSPEGRENNATDGANHWPEQTYFDRAAGPDHFTVRCRDLPDFMLAKARVLDDIAAGRKRVTLP